MPKHPTQHISQKSKNIMSLTLISLGVMILGILAGTKIATDWTSIFSQASTTVNISNEVPPGTCDANTDWICQSSNHYNCAKNGPAPTPHTQDLFNGTWCNGKCRWLYEDALNAGLDAAACGGTQSLPISNSQECYQDSRVNCHIDIPVVSTPTPNSSPSTDIVTLTGDAHISTPDTSTPQKYLPLSVCDASGDGINCKDAPTTKIYLNTRLTKFSIPNVTSGTKALVIDQLYFNASNSYPVGQLSLSTDIYNGKGPQKCGQGHANGTGCVIEYKTISPNTMPVSVFAISFPGESPTITTALTPSPSPPSYPTPTQAGPSNGNIRGYIDLTGSTINENYGSRSFVIRLCSISNTNALYSCGWGDYIKLEKSQIGKTLTFDLTYAPQGKIALILDRNYYSTFGVPSGAWRADQIILNGNKCFLPPNSDSSAGESCFIGTIVIRGDNYTDDFNSSSNPINLNITDDPLNQITPVLNLQHTYSNITIYNPSNTINDTGHYLWLYLDATDNGGTTSYPINFANGIVIKPTKNIEGSLSDLTKSIACEYTTQISASLKICYDYFDFMCTKYGNTHFQSNSLPCSALHDKSNPGSFIINIPQLTPTPRTLNQNSTNQAYQDAINKYVNGLMDVSEMSIFIHNLTRNPGLQFIFWMPP